MTDAQEGQLNGYLDSSSIKAISYPFAFGQKNESCLLITTTVGGWRYTDIVFPDGRSECIDQNELKRSA